MMLNLAKFFCPPNINMTKYNTTVTDTHNNSTTYKVEVAIFGNNLSDNIWFTRKARIQSEKRLLTNHTHSQLLLIYYSLWGVGFSIIAIKYDKFLGDDTSILVAIFSVIILVASLVVTNFSFKERSNQFKDNYVKLQELYNNSKKNTNEVEELKEIEKEYYKALKSVENHLNIDDICARVEIATSLSSRHPSVCEICKCYFYKVWKFFTIVSLYALPLLIFFLAN